MHPLARLGPSLIFTSVPLALGYSMHTLRGAGDRCLAITAVSLSGLEVVALAGLMLTAAMRA
jgi:hypothetical protein